MTPCPYCECVLADGRTIFEHMIRDHLDGMEPQICRPIGTAIEIGTLNGPDHATRTLGLDVVFRLQPEPGDDPADGDPFGRLVLLFNPDEFRQLGHMFIEAATAANARDS